MSAISYKSIKLPSDASVAYSEAGIPTSSQPTLLLLHGFPSSSFQYRNLIPRLPSDLHVLAPDLPFFGHTTVPSDTPANFDTLASVIGEFLDALKVTQFGVYIFDYGAPTAIRLALARPQAVKYIITQNGNGYIQGLDSPFWDPLKEYWKLSPGTLEYAAKRDEVARAALTLDATTWQYTNGVPADRLHRIDPHIPSLDTLLNLTSPASKEAQLDLFYSYGSNPALYPKFHAWLKAHPEVKVLVAWGGGDEIFPTKGGLAYGESLGEGRVTTKIFDGGHFLLETHVDEVAEEIGRFLRANGYSSA